MLICGQAVNSSIKFCRYLDALRSNSLFDLLSESQQIALSDLVT